MIGFAGTFARPRSLTAIEKTLTTKLNADCIVLPFGRKQIRTMGVVSGGGSQGEFQEAIQKGLDLYLTGDSTEIYHVARDAGINVIFAGHHATETVGVRALMDTVGRKLKVGTTFIDIRTGL
jgi:putative NIF3 family GTP cyclohydrolase 1 type 2